MPSRGRVIRTCNVTLNNNLLYNQLDLDISAIIDKHINKLIKTLEILETQVIELADNNNDLLDIAAKALTNSEES